MAEPTYGSAIEEARRRAGTQSGQGARPVAAAEEEKARTQPAAQGAYVTDPATGQQVYLPPNIDFAALAAAVPPDWEAAAAEIYGGYYAIIKTNTEIRELLLEAVKNKWGPDKFLYELRQTEWYQNTDAAAREWELQTGLEGAETTRGKIADQAQKIRETSLNMGLRLSDSVLNKIAEDSLKFKWTPQEVNTAIVDEANRGGGSPLSQGYFGQTVRTTASQYGIRLSDTTASDWSNRLATGRETLQSLEDYLLNTSKALYPALSSGFDRGLSFSDMTDPYAQLASRILEIPATQVDFTDPKWAKAMTKTNDKGEQSLMSYGEYADYLRSTPTFGWEYTDDAKNRAFTVANRLAELFGAA